MKNFKIIVAVVIVGFLITSGLVIWAGISLASYATHKAGQAIQSPATQEYLESLKVAAKDLSKFNAQSCWTKTQSFLALQPWMERSAFDNFEDLKVACLEHRPNEQP